VSAGPDKGGTAAAAVLIGNELLCGRTQDRNLAYIGRGLDEIGVRLMEARVVADAEGAIIAAVNALRERYDYVFTTGGIGPTHDDITTAAVAKAFDLAVVRSEAAVARMQAYYETTDIGEARLKMAEIPEGAALVDNPVSGAPGYRIDNVFVLAGIPRIMQAMFDSIRPLLAGGAPIRSLSIALYLRESVIAPGLAAIQARHPASDIGSYPFVKDARFGANVVARGTDLADLEAVIDEARALARSLGGDFEEAAGP